MLRCYAEIIHSNANGIPIAKFNLFVHQKISNKVVISFFFFWQLNHGGKFDNIWLRQFHGYFRNIWGRSRKFEPSQDPHDDRRTSGLWPHRSRRHLWQRVGHHRRVHQLPNEVDDQHPHLEPGRGGPPLHHLMRTLYGDGLHFEFLAFWTCLVSDGPISDLLHVIRQHLYNLPHVHRPVYGRRVPCTYLSLI